MTTYKQINGHDISGAGGGSDVPEEQTFDYTDFTANIATITHERGRKNVIVQIQDDNNLITSFDITLINTTTFTITTYGSFTGTYTVVIL